MKTSINVILLLSVGFMLSCTNKSHNNQPENAEQAASASPAYAPDSANIITIEDAYRNMQEIALPVTVNSQSTGKFAEMKPLPSPVFESITFTPQGFSNVKVAKLPAPHNTRAIIVSYKDSLDNSVEELITFKPGFQFVDRTRLYARDRVSGQANQQITTQSEIKDLNDIHIEQYLNGTLIASLHYRIAENGAIEEIRDGKTPAVIFESFDNETYFIESFVWQTLSTGGVRKTNLTKKSYKVAPNGEVGQVNP